ncbi:MAG TPA: hydroxymethylglutaryl-CoA reductase, degradative [Brevefilum fermentans]|nr:hydroxymethylglutaryl-CoA reductase, degradative [Chloroflexota bacterium]HPX95237.1 hydroxymethylglutaryl-CoA reductase, degradative [Brevefilum fermentans]HQA27701.1 hydroxymethylglutaryl-CoA reductase, degradative [Brevefilum fermentans]
MTANTAHEEKFYNLTPAERLARITDQYRLSAEDGAVLSGEQGLSLESANHMIENVIGTFSLPLGIARNFLINGREVPVPMVVEEPSIVAGASFMAKLARGTGGFFAHADAAEMIGQIQVLDLDDPSTARLALLDNKEMLLAEAARVDPVLIKLGGGPRDLEVRLIQESPIGEFVVVHLVYDVVDAMGANAVNTAVERLAPIIERITGGRVLLRILSNLADRRLARARVTINTADLTFGEFSGETVRDGIVQAWAFAAADPYRAATHNKGIMNGIDSVLIATGNDWRAVEAGAHAFAARGGRYTSLSTWSQDETGNLEGSLEMPMAVGTVGGATRVHPAAQACLRLMGIKSAADLAEVLVSVGLAQNLAALRALATEGIQRGHMTLHARQVAVAAGAQPEQIDALVERLIADKIIRIDHAIAILEDWNGGDRGQ